MRKNNYEKYINLGIYIVMTGVLSPNPGNFGSIIKSKIYRYSDKTNDNKLLNFITISPLRSRLRRQITLAKKWFLVEPSISMKI